MYRCSTEELNVSMECVIDFVPHIVALEEPRPSYFEGASVSLANLRY